MVNCMIVNLIENCMKSEKKEFYYGALMNREIKDVYLGYGYLDPNEERDFGPGENHEEIIMPINGEMVLSLPDSKISLKKGDAYFLKAGIKIKIGNLTNERLNFVIAGGHPVQHEHHH